MSSLISTEHLGLSKGTVAFIAAEARAILKQKPPAVWNETYSKLPTVRN